MARNTVNRESRGLLQLLRAKVGGQAPDTFDTKIIPQLDNLPYLTSSLMVSQNISTASVTGAGDLEFVVPDTETWLLYNLMGYVADATANEYFANFVLYIENLASSARASVAAAGVNTIGTPGASYTYLKGANWSPMGKVILQPGAKCGMEVLSVSGTSSARVSVLYAKLT